MKTLGKKRVWTPLIGILWIATGDIRAQESGTRTEALPQPAPGTLPALQPPPGVTITRDAFESLMRKPFNDDLETPPWERKKPPAPVGGEKVIRPEVLGEPEPRELIFVPETIGSAPSPPSSTPGLPPLQPPPSLPTAAPEAPALVFERNPYHARAKAVEEGKFMMLAFVGTEWNSASRQLSWEVFNAPEFLEFAKENVIPCYLDYPQKLSSGDHPLIRFKRHYKIGGLPALVIFDPEGTPYVKKSGYLPGTAEVYLAEVKALVKQRRELVNERREKLKENGYREWTNLQGRKFFGRMTKVEAGEVWFLDSLGKPAKVALEKLSATDRAHLGH